MHKMWKTCNAYGLMQLHTFRIIYVENNVREISWKQMFVCL